MQRESGCIDQRNLQGPTVRHMFVCVYIGQGTFDNYIHATVEWLWVLLRPKTLAQEHAL